VSWNVSIFTCANVPLICISIEQSTLFFSPIEWQGRLDISGILQTAFKSYLRAARFPFPIGCGGGEGCFIPVKSIQLRFYCMKLYNKKSFLILFEAWNKWVLLVTIKELNVMQQNIGVCVSKINAFHVATLGKHSWLLVYSLVRRCRLMRVPFCMCSLPQLLKYCTVVLCS
jgi:hypothetical protein